VPRGFRDQAQEVFSFTESFKEFPPRFVPSNIMEEMLHELREAQARAASKEGRARR
jgi:hypothetical protein